MGKALLYRALGLILCAFGLLFGLLMVGVFFGSGGPLFLIPCLLSWLCLWLGRASFKRAGRHSALGVEEVRKRDPRPPVLYLRSFQDDGITARSLTMHYHTGGPHGGGMHLLFVTEEQLLVKVLNEIGPVIAIGRPGEDIPELGAARKQVSDREWKTVVRNDMNEARLVVLRVGDGSPDAYWWEVEQAGLLPPEKVLFVVSDDKRLYSAFCEKAHKALTRLRGALPVYAGRRGPVGTLAGFMYFESDWTARFLVLKGAQIRSNPWSPLVPMIKASLQPVFEGVGVPWSRPSLNWLSVVAIAIAIGFMTMVEVMLPLSLGLIGLFIGLALAPLFIYWIRNKFNENAHWWQ
jgi:hypothetical protein